MEGQALIAESEPWATFLALTKSMEYQWSYVQRVVSGCQSLFDELESVIFEKLLPNMFCCEVTSFERELLSLPARMGGLGVSKPNEMSEMLFNIYLLGVHGSNCQCYQREFEIEILTNGLLDVKADICSMRS